MWLKSHITIETIETIWNSPAIGLHFPLFSQLKTKNQMISIYKIKKYIMNISHTPIMYEFYEVQLF